MKTFVVLVFFRSNRAHRVFIGSSSPARRPPSTDKRLREDLYKKVMSGDPVAARLPYAILMKMVAFSGWKRFEMNDTLKFHGVTEMTFPSTMRQSLIVNCKGRFVGAQRLASLLPGTQGYFNHTGGHERFRDLDSLRRVPCSLSSSRSCATWALRPSGKRLKGTLRAAGRAVLPGWPCVWLAGFLAEDVALHPDGAGHGVAPWPGAGVVQTVGARQVPGWLLGDEEGLVRCHVSLVKHCLERGWDFSSEHFSFTQLLVRAA